MHMIDENIENGETQEATTRQQLVKILDLAYELQKATEELYLNEVSHCTWNKFKNDGMWIQTASSIILC